jgi:hypothetical protein
LGSVGVDIIKEYKIVAETYDQVQYRVVFYWGKCIGVMFIRLSREILDAGVSVQDIFVWRILDWVEENPPPRKS